MPVGPAARDEPKDAFFVERREYGPLLGTPVSVKRGETVLAEGPAAVQDLLPELAQRAHQDRARIEKIEKGEIGDINFAIEKARLHGRGLDLLARKDPERDLSKERAEIERTIAEQKAQFQARTETLQKVLEEAASTYVTFRSADGREKELRSLDIFRSYPANQLGGFGRLAVYGSRLWEFFSAGPRESNTEGGIFPAIFGTVMMVLIMSIIVVPLGVLAALYLREYARQGPLVRRMTFLTRTRREA